MTQAQKMEVRRMTALMWELLWQADREEPLQPGTQAGRSARILERRGFLTGTVPPPGFRYKTYNIRLTEAGREALAWQRAGKPGGSGRRSWKYPFGAPMNDEA